MQVIIIPVHGIVHKSLVISFGSFGPMKHTFILNYLPHKVLLQPYFMSVSCFWFKVKLNSALDKLFLSRYEQWTFILLYKKVATHFLMIYSCICM